MPFVPEAVRAFGDWLEAVASLVRGLLDRE